MRSGEYPKNCICVFRSEYVNVLLVGELASFRDALLPAVAAIGGMLMPALIYYVLNLDGPTWRGCKVRFILKSQIRMHVSMS